MPFSRTTIPPLQLSKTQSSPAQDYRAIFCCSGPISALGELATPRSKVFGGNGHEGGKGRCAEGDESQKKLLCPARGNANNLWARLMSEENGLSLKWPNRISIMWSYDEDWDESFSGEIRFTVFLDFGKNFLIFLKLSSQPNLDNLFQISLKIIPNKFSACLTPKAMFSLCKDKALRQWWLDFYGARMALSPGTMSSPLPRLRTSPIGFGRELVCLENWANPGWIGFGWTFWLGKAV